MPAVNLLPPESRPRARKISLKSLALPVVLLVAAGIGGFFVGNYRETLRQISEITAARQSLLPDVVEAQTLQRELAALEEKRRAWNEVWNLRYPFSALLAGLRRSLPEEVWLTGLRVSETEIILEGGAGSSAALVTFLGRLNQISGLHNARLVRAEGSAPLTFTATADLDRPTREQSGDKR